MLDSESGRYPERARVFRIISPSAQTFSCAPRIVVVCRMRQRKHASAPVLLGFYKEPPEDPGGTLWSTAVGWLKVSSF